MRRISGSSAGFSLIEIMGATSVLSLVLLLMISMQDQMGRAWSGAAQRAETAREARAAIRQIAAEFPGLLAIATNLPTNTHAVPAHLTNRSLPWLLYTGVGTAPLTIPRRMPGSAFLFGVIPTAGNAQGDLSLIGYYVSSRPETNLNGLVVTNYHLFRYHQTASNLAPGLATYLAGTNRSFNLLLQSQPVNPDRDDPVAFHVGRFAVRPLGTSVTNGTNFTTGSTNAQLDPNGSRLTIAMSAYPAELAQRLPLNQWNSATNLTRFSRSFEFSLDLPTPRPGP